MTNLVHELSATELDRVCGGELDMVSLQSHDGSAAYGPAADHHHAPRHERYDQHNHQKYRQVISTSKPGLQPGSIGCRLASLDGAM
ncbi:hypothetical protein JQ597_20505 [Bradyrhizobium sp. AUGA SZCCT0177]|uniref:hypothetical protein n=1 Tax=Bradyrhizobium sp. AUGA SZCCT0177 TaxID=2807665 RepID=UPI001BA9ADBB|nr:hypothetical protein [Bradyrhizobium sp. AUGA SZCCT0177]MBR1284434.1 hypothetical protein [Bradyrhizobium sp. AUGA SZCCT0177]